MPTFDEVHRAYRQRMDRLTPDSANAFFEIMVARFITLAASIPFAAGALLAYHETGQFNWPVFIVGSITVFLIMGAVNAGNTYFDYETDATNFDFSAYSGGMRVLVEKKITERKKALWFAVGVMALAIPLGLSLRYLLHTGPWTIPLGLIGGFLGWFYTGKPLKLVYHGFGELIVASCSGALTVISGYYLLAGHFSLSMIPIAVCLAFSILNVILVNEFADAPSDARSHKRTWLVRLGPDRASVLYRINVVVGLLVGALGWALGLPLYVALVPVALAIPQAVQNWHAMARCEYRDAGVNALTLNTFKVHFTLEVLFAASLVVGGLVRWVVM